MRTERVVAALLGLIVAGGCKRDWIYIPAPPSQLVVHGVLNPADTMQIVLIERTITGAVYTPVAAPFDAFSEPINSDGGVAERHVTLEIIKPDGQVVIGTEYPDCYQVPPILCNGSGAGKYKFFLKGATLVPGGKYKLHAVTTAGEVITAETVIPNGAVATTTGTASFNRTTDSLSLSWPAVSAPAFQVRVENPNGSWSSFTDSTRVSLTGGLRNPNDARLGHVFLPGFRQLVSVTAIDANMYDYYRTTNNSFVGYGAVSRVNGAMGFFGSAVTVIRQTVTVTANQTLPIEGVFDAVDSGLGYVYFTNTISLFVESPATKRDEADAITGMYYNVSPSTSSPATGTFKDNKLVLNMPASLFPEVLYAELRGDTLVGKYSKGAPAKFVKRH